MSSRSFRLLLILLIGLQMTLPARAAEVAVAAAADLNFAIKAIIAGFERETGDQVKLTLGSSGAFFAQIQNGAPFQVFLSADIDYPRRLEADGKTEPGSLFVYALGRIAVWISRSSPLDIQKLQMNALLDPSIKKIAIANPEHAPYGRAAVAAMQKAGVYEQVKNKLVLGESVGQAAQFVESGAADAGIIALSLASVSPMSDSGKYWTAPADMHPRMEQGAVLLKGAGPAARRFLEELRSETGRRILQQYGFELPAATKPQ